MSHPLNPENLPMRGPTPIECAYDVLAVRWWWWTDPCPRGPARVDLHEYGAVGPFVEACRRLRDHRIYGLALPVQPTDALELALALADGSER